MNRVISSLALLLALLLTGAMAAPSALAADLETPEVQPLGSDEELAEVVQSALREEWEKDIAVAFCYTGTGETLYYRADEWYNTASLYKLPMIMQVARAQYDGDPSRFEHAFAEDIETVKHDVLAYSNNTYALGLANVFGEKQLVDGAIELAHYEPSEAEYKQLKDFRYSPRFFIGILKELYSHSELYPKVLEYMLDAQPEKYLRHDLEGVYPIAQKYGSVDGVNHIGGIIYTPTPILVVIMTGCYGASAGEARIGAIGKALVDYALELDERLAQNMEAGQIAAPSPEPQAQPQATEPAATPAPAVERETGEAESGGEAAQPIATLEPKQYAEVREEPEEEEMSVTRPEDLVLELGAAFLLISMVFTTARSIGRRKGD